MCVCIIQEVEEGDSGGEGVADASRTEAASPTPNTDPLPFARYRERDGERKREEREERGEREGGREKGREGERKRGSM
jgi:hypothetical protein